MSGIEEYDLTENEFKEGIVRLFLREFVRVKPAKKPTASFIISQPGAGKSGLKSHVMRENQTEEGYVEIDPDEVGKTHKYHNEIIEKYPNEAFSKLQEYISPAIDRYLRVMAMKNKYSMMQEGTFGNTKTWLEIIKLFKEGGKTILGDSQEVELEGNYDVNIYVLAVDRFESLLSSYEREQKLREEGLPPRAVLPKNHDFAHNAMLETIKEIENNGYADNIEIYKRGETPETPQLVYRQGDKNFHNAVECIETTRANERKKLFRNPEAYKARIQNLKDRVTDKGLMERINEIEKEFDEALIEYEKNIGEE